MPAGLQGKPREDQFDHYLVGTGARRLTKNIEVTNFEHDSDVSGARAPDPVDQGLPDLLIQWIRGRLGPRSSGSRPARSPDPVDQGLPGLLIQ